MPIPIPIPMPMGPSGGNKFHPQQHQQHHHNDGEGEVKKIYLLQPMPKVQPQPQLKGGGYMGPIQNHIHMQPQIVPEHKLHRPQPSHSPAKRDRGYSNSYGEAGELGDDYHNNEIIPPPAKGRQQQHSDVKILPIVVIPPIAPVPPIQQIPPSTNTHQSPRVTFKPQFNNYLVSSANEQIDEKPIRHSIHQDQRTFADYNVQGTVNRDNFFEARSRHRARRGRPNNHDNQHQFSHRIRSRAGYDRGDDMYGGNNDEYEITLTRSPARSSRRNGGFASRRRIHIERPPRVTSIRDIVEQHNLLDDRSDDYNVDHMRETSRINRLESCPGCNEQRRNPVHFDDNTMATSNTDQRDVPPSGALGGHIDNSDYGEQSSEHDALHSPNSRYLNRIRPPSNTDQRLPSGNSDRDEYGGEHSNESQTRQDLSLVQHDREVQQVNDQPYRSASNSANNRYIMSENSNNPTTNKRLYLDEREIFDDDEWRFDSIKSITHVSPNVTSIQTAVNATSANQANTTITPDVVQIRETNTTN